MLGERLIIGEDFKRVAEQLKKVLLGLLGEGKFVLTIAGESGSGKSGISAALADLLEEGGVKCKIIQQDDYFLYPPKTNEMKRREDLSWVGMNEVDLELLQKNVAEIKAGVEEIEKPLVVFDENKKIDEKVFLQGVRVVIVEGTYTTVLEDVDQKVFIDRIYKQTKKERLIKNREKQDDFLEKVLEIEHGIISGQRMKADLVITPEFEIVEE